MRVRITETGVYDTKENPVAVGTILEVAGDVIPAWLVNKCVAAGNDGAPIITGRPLTKAEQKAADKAASEKAAAEMKERVEYATTVLAITVDPSWTLEQLNAAITTAENPPGQ